MRTFTTSLLAVGASAAAVAALSGPATAKQPPKSRTQPVPLGGGNLQDFSIGRTTFAGNRGPRPTVRLRPRWSDRGTYAVAALRHAPHGQTVVFAFTANVPDIPRSQPTVVFRTPVSFYGGTIDPKVLSSGFDGRSLCYELPGGPVSPGSLAVLAAGGDRLGSLSPAGEIAESLDVACRRHGGTALRHAL